MIAYFVRRILGGIFAFFFATFVLHSMLTYAPSGMIDECTTPRLDVQVWDRQRCHTLFRLYHLDSAWPVSYVVDVRSNE